jgi:hypothetical protein
MCAEFMLPRIQMTLWSGADLKLAVAPAILLRTVSAPSVQGRFRNGNLAERCGGDQKRRLTGVVEISVRAAGPDRTSTG